MNYRKPIWLTEITKENIDWLTDKIYELAKEYLRQEELPKQFIYQQLKKELDAKEKKPN